MCVKDPNMYLQKGLLSVIGLIAFADHVRCGGRSKNSFSLVICDLLQL